MGLHKDWYPMFVQYYILVSEMILIYIIFFTIRYMLENLKASQK